MLLYLPHTKQQNNHNIVFGYIRLTGSRVLVVTGISPRVSPYNRVAMCCAGIPKVWN